MTQENETALTQNVPPWIAAMRAAAQAQIKQSDIEEIVKNQIASAKNGNKDAIKFIFEQVLGGAAPRAGTNIQNNYYDGKSPNAPTAALPGTPEKVEAMRRRVAAGQQPTNGKDAKRGTE